MRPSEAYEEVAGLLTATVKRPFRDEPITYEEWDTFADLLYQFIGKQKARCHGTPSGTGSEAERSTTTANGRAAKAQPRTETF